MREKRAREKVAKLEEKNWDKTLLDGQPCDDRDLDLETSAYHVDGIEREFLIDDADFIDDSEFEDQVDGLKSESKVMVSVLDELKLSESEFDDDDGDDFDELIYDM
jgi:hypothetical protein